MVFACIRELLDNAIDFLAKYYKGANDTVISTVRYQETENTFSIKVQIQITRIYQYCKTRKLYSIMICDMAQNNICILLVVVCLATR